MLAESGAGGEAGAPHDWLTATYIVTHLQALACGVELVGQPHGHTGVTVHGVAHVLLPSDDVITQEL